MFVPQLGGVVSDAVAPPGAARLDAATLVLLGSLLAGDWPTAEASDDRARHQANGVVAAYTQFHLERGLRSLPHLDRTTVPSGAPPPLRRTASPADRAPLDRTA